MTQSIKGSRAGVFAACQSIYSTVKDGRGGKILVCYGPPGKLQQPWIVAIGDTRQPIMRPTLGPKRSREKNAEIDVTISCYAAGTETVQQTITEACDDLVELLEAFFRTSPNEKLSGACRDSWVSNVDGPKQVVAVHPKTGNPTGRVAEATVTVTTVVRY